jgi:hypothetical protein
LTNLPDGYNLAYISASALAEISLFFSTLLHFACRHSGNPKHICAVFRMIWDLPIIVVAAPTLEVSA